jgi:hypothetical protein
VINANAKITHENKKTQLNIPHTHSNLLYWNVDKKTKSQKNKHIGKNNQYPSENK